MKKSWTDKEKDTLSSCYADTPTAIIAEWFDRSVDAIYRQATIQRLKKSKGFITAEIRAQWANNPNYEASKHNQFKPGSTPANKGKKQTEYMSADAIARTAATRFGKGNLPHNTKEGNGHIVERKDKSGIIYKYIKIADGKWELLQREVWRKHNGAIPKGMLIVFKDGNQRNVIIENLEMITKKENMARNTKLNLPEDVQKIIAAKGAVTRILNQLKNK